MDRVKPSELETAARIAEALVYAAGVAGVIAGGLLYRQGSPGFALVAWVLTFVAGAGLRLAAWGARALSELLVRTAAMEGDLAELRGRQAPEPPPDPEAPPDPYRRWRGWH